MRILATVAAVTLLGSWAVADAQEQLPGAVQPAVSECLCNLSVESGAPVASLENVRGQVLMADGRGYSPVQSRTELTLGDRIILLREGQANLTAGTTCRVALTPGSVVSVLDAEGRACITRAATIVPAQAPPGDDDFTNLQQDGMFFVGSMAFGLAVAAAASELGEDPPVSP